MPDLFAQEGLAFAPQDRLTNADILTWPVAHDWQPVVDAFTASPQGRQLAHFLGARIEADAVIYPPAPFRALTLTPLHSVRVVILGQDPYHGAGQAEGLAFSVAPGVKQPPSLRNIVKELQREQLLPAEGPRGGSLTAWATQGVLLLNTCLTVEEGQAASHAKKGWEALTDALIQQVAASARSCVYLLWGAHAQSKAALVQQTVDNHGHSALVLQANHPSPLSALRPPVPFIGCDHFREANIFLEQIGAQPVDWSRIG